MRALLWVTILLASLWTAVWWYASGAALNGAKAWIDGSSGRVGAADVSVSGFPNRVDLTVTGVQLHGSSVTWRAPFLQIFAMTWKPWQLIGVLPPGSQLRTADQDITLNGTQMRGSATLNPSNSLALAEAIVEGHNLDLISTLGWSAKFASLIGAVKEDLVQKHGYRVGLRLQDIGFDRATTQGITNLGLAQTISQIHLDARVTLTAPLDRFSAATLPRLDRVQLTNLSFDWDDVSARIEGDMQSDSAGLATGALRFRVQGWRKLLNAGAAYGVLSADQAAVLGRGLAEVAKGGSDKDALDFSVTAAGGVLYFGALPIGTAFRLQFPLRR